MVWRRHSILSAPSPKAHMAGNNAKASQPYMCTVRDKWGDQEGSYRPLFLIKSHCLAATAFCANSSIAVTTIMPSTFCKACSSIPWAELHRRRSGWGHASNPFSYHPSPASCVARDACSMCRILFPTDLELGSECVTVRVKSYHYSAIGKSGQEPARIVSVIFERALTDQHKVIIAEFNVSISRGDEHRSLRSRGRHFLNVVVSAFDIACCFSSFQIRTSRRAESTNATNHERQLGFIVANTPTSEMLVLPRSWMETCIQTHETCKPADAIDLPLPTRLLHIGLQSGDSIRLVEVPAGCYGRYAALSHCWGDRKTFTTSPESLSTRKKDIRFCELPPTFQNAVTVSRDLGLNYLWIDSLCIIQGDTRDWRSEALKMKDVYSNATLVISASRSTSDSTGFLLPRIAGKIMTAANDKMGKKSAIHLQQVINSLTPYADALVSEPLHKRAWALQERYLSTRTLFFASHQMFWECKTLSLAEDGRRQEIPKYRVHQLVPVKMDAATSWMSNEEFTSHKPWYSMVATFMSCDITFYSDRLPAVSGLAESLNLKTADTYLAGIWKRSLTCGLMWRKYRCSSLARQKSYRAPSWSWASVEGEIEFCIFTWFNDFPHGIESFISIQSCSIEANGNPFGTVKGGHISLYAPMFPVYAQKGPFKLNDFPELSSSQAGAYLQSFGSFHRVFDVIFGFQYAQHILFISGSFDFPHDHQENMDLYIIFLAGETQPPLAFTGEPLPSNEGYFGLLIQRSLKDSRLYSRVGVVHGKLMAEDEGLQTRKLFEEYRLWRKQDYLASISERETRPNWFRIPFNQQEKELVKLV